MDELLHEAASTRVVVVVVVDIVVVFVDFVVVLAVFVVGIVVFVVGGAVLVVVGTVVVGVCFDSVVIVVCVVVKKDIVGYV